VLGFLVDGRQEDDRNPFGLFAAANDARGLVAVHARHIDVQKDDRELALEQVPQRLLAGFGQHHVGNVLEHRLDREQVALVVIHDEDACPLQFGMVRF